MENKIVQIVFLFFLFSFQTEALFIRSLQEEHKPKFICKICVLYCSPKNHHKDESTEYDEYAWLYPKSNNWARYDEDHTFVYTDWDTSDQEYDYPNIHSLHHAHQKHTTTAKPATTTEEPSGICMFCIKKCHYPRPPH